jgi:hypothetical protein
MRTAGMIFGYGLALAVLAVPLYGLVMALRRTDEQEPLDRDNFIAHFLLVVVAVCIAMITHALTGV